MELPSPFHCHLLGIAIVAKQDLDVAGIMGLGVTGTIEVPAGSGAVVTGLGPETQLWRRLSILESTSKIALLA
jgi:hypothetical protein